MQHPRQIDSLSSLWGRESRVTMGQGSQTPDFRYDFKQKGFECLNNQTWFRPNAALSPRQRFRPVHLCLGPAQPFLVRGAAVPLHKLALSERSWRTGGRRVPQNMDLRRVFGGFVSGPDPCRLHVNIANSYSPKIHRILHRMLAVVV